MCRAANAAYVATHRRRVSVAALESRAHLQSLESAGIGVRQVAALSGVSRSTVAAVRDGTRTQLHPSTAARLLATAPVRASGALVKATTSWRFIDSLEREGYTRRELAWHYGHRSQQLSFGRRKMRGATVAKVAALYARLAE